MSRRNTNASTVRSGTAGTASQAATVASTAAQPGIRAKDLGTLIIAFSPTLRVQREAGLDIIDVYARTSLIPQCAMRVTRTSDSGELMPCVPTRSCGCYYEQLATGVARPEGCTSCTVGGSECGAGTECVTFTGASGTTSSYCE